MVFPILQYSITPLLSPSRKVYEPEANTPGQFCQAEPFISDPRMAGSSTVPEDQDFYFELNQFKKSLTSGRNHSAQLALMVSLSAF